MEAGEGWQAGARPVLRYAKATFRKDRRLNIRLSSRDLEAIQKRAMAEGLPYQTLIASLLHKDANRPAQGSLAGPGSEKNPPRSKGVSAGCSARGVHVARCGSRPGASSIAIMS